MSGKNSLNLIGVCLLGLAVGGCATDIQPNSRHARKLAGKTIVITGASSGFGRGAAVKLGSLHANVVLAARRTGVLEEVAAEIRAAGGTPLVVTTDVTKPEDIRHLADMAVKEFGRIDVWVNNAGVGAIGPFENIPDTVYSRLIDINFKGVVYGSHAAMERFRTQGDGTLINVGSIDSEVPLAYQAVYAASKAAVLSLTQTLHQEIRLSGKGDTIKVTTIMPWAVDTPWWGHAANYSGGTPRMAGMDDPQKVVDAIVWSCLYPTKKMPVGWKAKASYGSHYLFPDTTEYISGNLAHQYQIEEAPPAPATEGTLFEPMMSGTDVDDGVRARMEQEEDKKQ